MPPADAELVVVRPSKRRRRRALAEESDEDWGDESVLDIYKKQLKERLARKDRNRKAGKHLGRQGASPFTVLFGQNGNKGPT